MVKIRFLDGSYRRSIKSSFKLKLKEKEADQHIKDMAAYKLNKEKVFIIILGQCDIALINQLEANTDCKSAETKADAPKPLEMIKSDVHAIKGIQCEHWALSYSMRKVIAAKQGKFESLNTHCNRFMDLVEVAEAQWGFVPS